jgi:N-methylhydantoinase A/oxoprolinase/acetone carboxylase beta subunit
VRLRAAVNPTSFDVEKSMRVATGSQFSGRGYRDRTQIGKDPVFKGSLLKTPVIFDGKKQSSRLFSRDDLERNKKFTGPAIISEYSATTVVPPGKLFHLDSAGNLIISLS